MHVPTVEEANAFLDEAESLNPGPWVAHSRVTAWAAQALAQALPELDATVAYVLGLLHDIGRRAGVSNMRHLLDGYAFLHARGYEDAARICLTHSFPVKEIRSYCGAWDVGPAEVAFIGDYIAACEYDDYDRLIQLCDACCLPTGPCLMEKRLVDVYLRYGTNEYTVPKWQGYLGLLREFERRLGRSVYTLWPGVVENTFGASIIAGACPAPGPTRAVRTG